jgi:hypothetical protein
MLGVASRFRKLSLKDCAAHNPSILFTSFCLCLISLVSVSAHALDPDMDVSQYAHAAWLMQDGYFSGVPNAIAQGAGGYLWIGTQSGLLRFDGVRFLPWTPPDGTPLPSTNIRSLLGARDGSLWIGTPVGIAHLVNDKLVEFPNFHDEVNSILEDATGKIWFSRSGNKPGSPICEVSGPSIHCLDKSDGVSLSGNSWPLVTDASGYLWAGTDRYLLSWRSGSLEAYTPHGFDKSEGQDGVVALASAPQGALWVGMIWTGKGRGLQQFTNGKWNSVIAQGLDTANLSVNALLLDRDGGLWVGTIKQGIYHIHGSHVDRFGAEQGLSANKVKRFYEDREGGIWVVTTSGIDSFHRLPVITLSSREGLSEDNVVSVAVSRDDALWIANGSSLETIKHGRISSIQSGKGLPGNEVTALFADHAGQLWVGVDSDLFLYREHQFKRVRRRDGSSTRFIVGMTEDARHDIWAEVSGSNRELIRVRNLQVIEEYPAAVVPSARVLAADEHDGIWLGLRDGNLARFRNGAAQVFSFPHKESAEVHQVVVNPDGSVFGTTPYGLIAWRNGKTQMLTSRNGLPCDGIIGASWDNTGALWLYTECGLVRIDKTEIQAWWKAPETIVATRLFDAFDGVQTGLADFSPVAKSGDGKLWFANKVVLQMIDPAHLELNPLAPPVRIERVVAQDLVYPGRNQLRLPPHTRDIQIDYTALDFVSPRRVLFRVMLAGHDLQWKDVGTRRSAFYTNLSPGAYTFLVRACNNDGVWNNQGAKLAFFIEPAWYQTLWFRGLSLLCAVFLGYVLYLIRLRQYDSMVKMRFNERLQERTRIARDLHDTLLQTIQGSKLVADEVQDYLDDPPKAKHRLDILSRWLSQAIEEGRAALESLRSSSPGEQLSDALRHAAEDSAPGSMQVSLTVRGKTMTLQPSARDEVYRIALEAIRNACIHSRASEMDIELTYGRDLTIKVHDNGRGFDPSLVQTGKPGHFGMSGMKERASRIGARVSFATAPGNGTFPSSGHGWRRFVSKKD